MSEELSVILADRRKTHGDFADHARITTELKSTLRSELLARAGRDQPPLSCEHREALDMIVHKIGRILAGDACARDHWDDIAGYATLAAKACDRPGRR